MSRRAEEMSSNRGLDRSTRRIGPGRRITSELHRQTEVGRLLDNAIDEAREGSSSTRFSRASASSSRNSKPKSSTECTECNKVLSSKGNLNRHVKMVHLGHKVYCTYPGCGMSFGQSHDLRRHVRRKHGGR